MADRNLPEVWEVEWVDSSAGHGWNKNAEARQTQPDVITTVGFLLETDSKQVVICPSTVHMPESEYNNHARFECPAAIPKCAVRRMKRMRQARR